MIIYTNEQETLGKFYSIVVQFINEGREKTFLEVWGEAGGNIFNGARLVDGELLDEKQKELDAARNMIELQQESLRVKNKRIEELEITLRVLQNNLYEERHSRK